MATALNEPGINMDKLSYEIFSILETKFLFGDDSPTSATPPSWTFQQSRSSGKVRILSIDGGDCLLAGAALVRLESLLQKKSGHPAASIAGFFDLAAGSGLGGVLAAMLFTRGPDGLPLFTAKEALNYLTENRLKLSPTSTKGLFKAIFRRSGGGLLRRIFADATLQDTLKPLLIPCYDLSTAAPFLFSRADAVEMVEYDFAMSDVCAATCNQGGPTELKSISGRTRINTVGGALTMQNPTAAAITHVLNNKHEFPFAERVEDLIVLSLGGVSTVPSSSSDLLRIGSQGLADMVDQAVAMAFGEHRTKNYVRIQGSEFGSTSEVEVMAERNVESVMFRGKRVSEERNGEKLERFSGELVKEGERRRMSLFPTVIIKQTMSPRMSSATTSTVMTSTSSSSRASSSP